MRKVSGGMNDCGTDDNDAVGLTHAYCSVRCMSVAGDSWVRAGKHTGIDARVREENGQITTLSCQWGGRTGRGWALGDKLPWGYGRTRY